MLYFENRSEGRREVWLSVFPECELGMTGSFGLWLEGIVLLEYSVCSCWEDWLRAQKAKELLAEYSESDIEAALCYERTRSIFQPILFYCILIFLPVSQYSSALHIPHLLIANLIHHRSLRTLFLRFYYFSNTNGVVWHVTIPIFLRFYYFSNTHSVVWHVTIPIFSLLIWLCWSDESPSLQHSTT